MGTLDRHWKKIVVLVLFVSISALIRHRKKEASAAETLTEPSTLLIAE